MPSPDHFFFTLPCVSSRSEPWKEMKAKFSFVTAPAAERALGGGIGQGGERVLLSKTWRKQEQGYIWSEAGVNGIIPFSSLGLHVCSAGESGCTPHCVCEAAPHTVCVRSFLLPAMSVLGIELQLSSRSAASSLPPEPPCWPHSISPAVQRDSMLLLSVT